MKERRKTEREDGNMGIDGVQKWNNNRRFQYIRNSEGFVSLFFERIGSSY